MAKKQYDRPEDFRYERKFAVPELTKREVESIISLHPAMFREIFYERFVNNMYCDTLDMKNYSDNVDGLQNRVKIRIRWYSDLHGSITKPILEIKIKNGLVGKKQSFPLAEFQFNDNFGRKDYIQLIKKSELPDNIKQQLLLYEPVFVNRYRRRYFISSDGMFRLTVDSGQQLIGMVIRRPRVFDLYEKEPVIVELKYDSSAPAGMASSIASGFPFRMTRNSKYVNCIDSLFA